MLKARSIFPSFIPTCGSQSSRSYFHPWGSYSSYPGRHPCIRTLVLLQTLLLQISLPIIDSFELSDWILDLSTSIDPSPLLPPVSGNTTTTWTQTNTGDREIINCDLLLELCGSPLNSALPFYTEPSSLSTSILSQPFITSSQPLLPQEPTLDYVLGNWWKTSSLTETPASTSKEQDKLETIDPRNTSTTKDSKDWNEETRRNYEESLINPKRPTQKTPKNR